MHAPCTNAFDSNGRVIRLVAIRRFTAAAAAGGGGGGDYVDIYSD
jgi:hypothetical protein